jgi:hypothetical protein
MSKVEAETLSLPTHGARVLPSVEVDSYNVEIEDEDGFVGDKASRKAFQAILDDWRKHLKDAGEDPFGDKPTRDISKKELTAVLVKGESEAAGAIQSAIEDYAQQLAIVVRRFKRLKGWRDTECLVIGGGFRASRIGELAIGRTGMILRGEGVEVDLEPIRNDPDEAGLIGAAHLLPPWMLKGYDAILAVDVGGTNIRAGVVELNLKKSPDLAKAKVWESELWRHADDDVKRDDAIDRLSEMLSELIAKAEKSKVALAPVIGIGCPGIIEEDGSIKRGAQNLPGNWESSRFILAKSLREKIPTIGEHETSVVIHNDAVVQGLSELPFVKDRLHWGVLTMGTGLGNAKFTTRKVGKAKE